MMKMVSVFVEYGEKNDRREVMMKSGEKLMRVKGNTCMDLVRLDHGRKCKYTPGAVSVHICAIYGLEIVNNIHMTTAAAPMVYRL